MAKGKSKLLTVVVLCVCAVVTAITLAACAGEHAHRGDWKEEVASTCIEKGTEKRKCEICNKWEERKTEVKPHNYIGGVCSVCSNKTEEWSAEIDDITYKFTSGVGAAIIDYKGGEETLSIPETVNTDKGVYKVVEIGKEAFEYSNLTNVSIPNGVIKIGDKAFNWNSNLIGIILPDGLESIGEQAFGNCSALLKITISNSVKNVGKNAFKGCTELTIACEAKEQPMGWHSEWRNLNGESECAVIWDCKNNEQEDSGKILHTAENGVKYILKDGVATVTNQNLNLSGVIEIAQEILHNNKPYMVTTVGKSAFKGCRRLTGVIIPNTVTEIQDNAFQDCGGLTKIVIESEQVDFGRNVFAECLNISSAELPTAVISYVPKNSLENVVINGGSVVKDSSFEGCTSLKSVTFNSNITIIGASAFNGCTSLIDIKLPDSIISIGDSAFYECDAITAVNIPNNTTIIGAEAFKYCRALTNVIVPRSVTTIGVSAFEDCSNLIIYNEIEQPIKPDGWAAGWDKKDASGAKHKSVWGYEYLSFGGVMYGLKNDAATLVLQSSALGGDVDIISEISNNNKIYKVIYMMDAAFENCRNIIGVSFPNTITSISVNAFKGCVSLQRVKLSNDVEKIGDYAFYQCESLMEIFLPESIYNIGKKVFSNCDLITIKCAVESQPESWDKDWNIKNAKGDRHVPIWGQKN